MLDTARILGYIIYMPNYENYSIYELRELARTYGVKAPTTKKRDVLIKEITLIKENKLQPVFTHKGRPSKTLKLIKQLEYNSKTIKLSKSELINLIKHLQSLETKLAKYL